MIWLSVSLFSCKSEWNKLLSNGVAVFLAADNTNGLLDAYTIEFNYLSGENIRFSLLTSLINAPDLARHVDAFFKDHFLNAGLLQPEVSLPVNGIFMPFPGNTIQYGLYPPLKINKAEKGNYHLSITLSQIMLMALKDEPIDEETILTFAFYLQVGLIKCIYEAYSQSVDIVKSVYGKQTHQLLDINIVKEKFEESKDMLTEITRDIMGNDLAAVPEWLTMWLEGCRVEIKKYSVENDKGQTIYKKTAYLTIHKQLAISAPMSLMLNYFIEQAFQLINADS